LKELLDQLTKQLGISQTQAQVGTAILFKAAQDKLGNAEFQKLLGGVPGVTELLKLAPANGSGLMGSLVAALGGNAAMVANVVTGFSRLGMSTDTVKKFRPFISDFLHKHVGAEAVTKLEAALRA
jgi:hypothetical protein